ncbi:aromatic compound dioxygenase [Flagelloscypha sp. PMI_526]|nr:aromatic compound dioxygenase [Flagelloscypha sp. PMI_526]
MPSLVSVAATASLLLAPLAFGHAHDFSDAEVARRMEYQMHSRRSLAACSSTLRKRDGAAQNSVVRRMNFLEEIRRTRGIQSTPTKRSLESVLAKDHKSNLTGITNSTDSSTFFTDPQCVLGAEVTEGPYYVSDELVRFDLRDGQQGVPLWVDVELIDVSTCKGVPDVYIDFWHANSTGVYSGIVASGNGDGSSENMQENHGRGIQKTNSSGVVQFLTNFPGHYTGRATHIHISANKNGTLNKNGTYSAASTMHVGQLFFDQSLLSEIDKVAPYNTNTQTVTENDADSILSGEAANIDPFLEYVLVGSDISQGIFAWVSMGINTSNAHVASNAATLTSNGSVANANAMGGGPDGMGGGPGGPPGSNSSASNSTSSGASSGNSATSMNLVGVTAVAGAVMSVAALFW